MPAAISELHSTWIIGYGNPHRRDDGIGPYVVERLSRDLWGERDIVLRSLHQLDPVLAEEVQGAEVLLNHFGKQPRADRSVRRRREHPAEGAVAEAHRAVTELVQTAG